MVLSNEDTHRASLGEVVRLSEVQMDILRKKVQAVRGSDEYIRLEREYEKISKRIDELNNLSLRALTAYVRGGSFGGAV